MAKQLEEGKISILPLRLAFSAHIKQLMFTFSKQLVSVNIQQMPGFTITLINACVCLCGQSDNVGAAHLSLSLISFISTQYTQNIFHCHHYTDNTLLHIIFDFSTIKRTRVQTWNVRCYSFRVCVCVCVHVSLSFTWKCMGFIQMPMPLSVLMLMS